MFVLCLKPNLNALIRALTVAALVFTFATFTGCKVKPSNSPASSSSTSSSSAAATTSTTSTSSPTAATLASIAFDTQTFANTLVGNTSAAVTFTATNSGQTAATIAGVASVPGGSKYTVTGGTCAAGALAAGATCTVTVTFSPTVAGTITDTLTLTYNDSVTAGQTATASLSALATSSTASFDLTTSGSFNKTYFGSSSNTVTYVLTNNGGAAGTVTTRVLTTGTSFSISTGAGGDCTDALALAAAATCNIRIVFNPAANADATVTDTLTVTYHNGTTGGQTTTAAPSADSLKPLTISFAGFTDLPAGTTSSTTADITVTNNGTTTANTFSFSYADGTLGISTTANACNTAGTLAAGASCTITLKLQMAAALTINSTTLAYTSAISDTYNFTYSKSATAKATTTSVSGTAAPYNAGLGTVGSPYEIGTVLQFRVITDYPDKYFKQTAHLDFEGIDGAGATVPAKMLEASIVTAQFTGNYDGNSKQIKNLYIDDNAAQAGCSLFADLGTGANIHDLTILNYYLFCTAAEAAVIAGVSGGDTTLYNIAVSGPLSSTLVAKGGLAGGFVASGAGETITIENSSFSGTIDAAYADVLYSGGFVGWAKASSLTIKNSSTSGTITCAENYCGGLAGQSSSDLVVLTGSSSMTLSQTGAFNTAVGGLIGKVSSAASTVTGTITSSKFTGTINNTGGSSFYTGGLVAEHSGAQDSDVDGYYTSVGDITLTISKSWSSGSVDGRRFAGGILGTGTGTNLDRVFSRAAVSVTGQYAGGIAYSNAAGTISDSYFLGSVLFPNGSTGAGILYSNDHTTVSRTYSGATYVKSPDGTKGTSINSTVTGTYTNVFDFLDDGGIHTVSQVYYNNQADPILTGVLSLNDEHCIDSARYSSFDFTLGNGYWIMPSANTNYGALTPVLEYQCGIDGITCPP